MREQYTTEQFERQVSLNLSGVSNILLGLSGGADSMALMLALRRLGVDFTAIHCNFHLRGEESNRDQRFVEQRCQQLDIELIVEDFDVEKYMSAHGVSLEMACREMRYDRFRELMKSRGFSRIATAHHADDNIETMLLNMLRGCGLTGLKGISLDTGEIIRPLLSFTKQQILDYMNALGESYVTDSTNMHSDVRRNFIRNEVIPLLETRWAGARKALYATQENIGRAYKVYEKAMHDLVSDGSRILLRETIKDSADALSLIHYFASPYGANRSMEEEMALAICCDSFGQQWHTNYGIFYLSRTALIYYDSDRVDLSYSCVEVSRKELSEVEIKGCPLDKVYLPAHLNNYRFRSAKKGERFKPINMKGSKLVSDIFKEAKIPVPLRATYPVLVDDADEIVWIPCVKRSRISLVEADTNPIYIVSAAYKEEL
jgi:tRNA(Ile)-lysidine synthase